MALTNTQQLFLVALFALWAALLFGGFIFGKTWADKTRRMPVWTRMASSLVLVIAAWSLWLFASTPITTSFSNSAIVCKEMNQAECASILNFYQHGIHRLFLAFAVGMTFGLIGDLFMAKLLIKGENHLYGGIGAFSLGHIAYLVGMLIYANDYYKLLPTLWIAWGFWLLVGLIGWLIIVYPSGEPAVTRFAALPYTLLLASTAGIASGLALQDMRFPIVAVGAALFLTSDLILAAGMFRKWHFRLIDDVVWLTYGPGQMLIVFGIMLTSGALPVVYGGTL